MARLEITKGGSAQKIWFRSDHGRPSSTPSVGIKDKGGATVVSASTSNVTVDPVNTTVSVAAAIGDVSVSLTSVTGLRLYQTIRLTNAAGQYEDVRIRSLTNPIALSEPLERSYAIGASAVSCEWYYTLQAADVDTEDELYIATSTYSVTGAVVKPIVVAFDVVIHPLVNPLTADLIRSRHPDLFRQEYDEQRGEDYAPQRAAVFDILMQRIRQHGFRPAMIVTSEDLELWALAEFSLMLERSGISVMRGVSKEIAIERLRIEANDERTIALSSIKYYDRDESESIGSDEQSPLRMDFVR